MWAFDVLGVYENIIFGLDPDINFRPELEQIIEKYQLTSIFDDKPFLDLKISKGSHSLSGGQRQIILLLHAILKPYSKIILLDEPTIA